MPRSASLPFLLKRSEDLLTNTAIESTTETVHGLLRLEGDSLTIQWRVGRKTDHVGNEIRTDHEYEDVREIVVPLSGVAGAVIRRPWWEFWRGPRIVLTAADLRAFEEFAGDRGIGLGHPAELTLRLRRRDRLAGEEFSAELALAIAERQLAAPDRRGELEAPPDAGA